MTDEELIARLRDFATREASAMPPGWPDAHGLYSDAADRIAALSEQLAAARRDAEEAEAYAGELESNGLANRVAIMRLKAKLATCEKYRDAYAECDRIGTQAVRDLEARAERLEAAASSVADDVCSYICPSVGRVGEPILHDPRCIALRAALKGADHDG